MKQRLNLNLVISMSCYSSLYKPSLFHTTTNADIKAYLVGKLQTCKDLTSATLTHSKAIISGLSYDTFTTNHLINCYLRLLRIDHAHKLFDQMSQRNVVSWTSLMAGYVSHGQPIVALRLFHQMQASLVLPNEFTFATLINACSILANIDIGRRFHALIEIMGFGCNLVVCSSLIDMYGKCNLVDEARLIFDSMCIRNVVSWTSMITTYAQNAIGHYALQLFREFNHLRLDKPNHFMLCSVISACASLGKLGSGKITHGVVIRRGHDANDVIATTLVDMYAKCGCVHYSTKVFRRIQNPSVIPYTSMIVGAAKYGLGTLSLQLFEEMVDRRIKPNDVTFVGALHACSHSGLVDKGLEILDSMNVKYGVMPDAKHYTCIADMLGRVGRIEEAYQLAKSVQVERDGYALLWGTLLSASRLHGRVDIAVEASKRLIESNQQVAGAYVTLSNTYALAGDWENAHNLRSEMKRTGIQKEPGSSWIEIKESTYLFHAGDISNCNQRSEMLSLLRELEERMKEKGYVGGTTGVVFLDVEEEAKVEIMSLHSEKLALAFGLINTPKGVTIRIMKNLRMCRDCHETFKLISDIVERDFIVRDVNRFHHFNNGLCTCGDFW
ncbi:putative tetratricopeptide-like helical domain, DYW domain-containing protein [Lupinus albus]|uniref:Putative tetratricopeptide-like helical domain, DYW domain-containing protein n=1 Tax=Lupinus albus TaxID=3870 RepID=A0A6A4PKK2_LUPAL|nr:putative tetratricopeptide-like helical domain, DYW domain-containing protein [Lupinus albus]